MPKQAANLLESVRNQVSRKAIRMMPVSEVLRESLQIVHVLGKISRDVGLQNLKHSAFSQARLRILPRETDHCTDTGLLENVGGDFHLVSLCFGPKRFQNYGPNVFGPHVSYPVFQPRKRLAQSWMKMLVAGDHLA